MTKVPEYLQHNKMASILSNISRHQSGSAISLDFDSCTWADHFELQRLAVHVAAQAGRLSRADIHLRTKHDGRVDEKRHFDFVDYACRMHFFSFLAYFWKEKIKFIVDNSELTIDSTMSADGQILARLPESRSIQEHSRTFIPMTLLANQSSVDQVSETFSTGDNIQQLLSHYTDMDFLKSGEFSTLVVTELAQNVVEHAWSTRTNSDTPGPASISLVTVTLGSRKDPAGRFATRTRYAPSYERAFLGSMEGPGYLELCVSDAGIGIPNSLKECKDSWSSWFERTSPPPSSSEFLAAAFWAKITRDSGPHRPGYRGLFYVLECVREYRGALSVHCPGVELSIATNTQDWIVGYTKRNPLRAIVNEDVLSTRNSTLGTHLRILLPLSQRLRRRSHWNLKVIAPAERFAIEGAVELPPIYAAPTAGERPPTTEGLRQAMEIFRSECRSMLNNSQPLSSVNGREWLWVSSSTTRTWRKHHFQTLLDELLLAKNIDFFCFLNIPKPHFFSFLFVARHVLTIEQGRLILLVDESGRFSFVYREHKPLYEKFARWATEGTILQTEADAVFGLLGDIARETDQELAPLSFAHLVLLLMRKGIDLEFSGLLEGYRDSDRPVRIAEKFSVVGYVELDEALREWAYLRSLSSYIDLCIRSWIRPNGIIAVRRAATRLLEFNGPLGDGAVWTMAAPEKEYLPSAAWLEDKHVICIVTDVVARGESLSRLIIDLIQRRGPSASDVQFFVIAPLLADLISRENHDSSCSVEDSSLPGLSFLHFKEGGIYPLAWIQRITAQLQPAEEGQSLVPDARTNIIVEERKAQVGGREKSPGLPAIEFIRLAEAQNAIWIDHLVITGEHFDVEFDMSRLLREGSLILKGFCGTAARLVVDGQIDTVLFPDESRIQLAIPGFVDELRRMEVSIPHIIRCRRGAEGRLFIRPQDDLLMSAAKRLLLLDDAINSGGTARQMIEIGSSLPARGESLVLLTLISRQSMGLEDFLASVSAFNGVPFDYRAYTRFPVKFYSPTDCPLCRRERQAKSFSVAQGPPSPVTIAMQLLAQSLKPIDPYSRSERGSYKSETRQRYPAPVCHEQSIETTYLKTSAGARAAIAVAVASQKKVSPSFVVRLLGICEDDISLRAYTFYACSSRSAESEELWGEQQFRDHFLSCCSGVGKRFRLQIPEEEHSIYRTLVDLCMAAWFAPYSWIGWAIGSLLRLCESALSYDRFHHEILFLILNLKSGLGLVSGVDKETKAVSEVRTALADARRVEANLLRHSSPPLDFIERLMRLRQVAQVLDSLPFREPWLEGVVQLLEKLSFVAGHEWLGFVSSVDVAAGGYLLEDIEVLLGRRESSPFRKALSPSEVERSIDNFLATPREDIIRLSRSFKESFGAWFRALSYANNLDELSFLEEQLADAEETVKRLVSNLISAEVDRRRDLDRFVTHLSIIHETQVHLREVLYAREGGRGRTLRSEIEKLLCPMYSLSPRFRRDELVNEYDKVDGEIVLTGSFFDYMELVGVQGKSEKRFAKWTVFLAPQAFVEEILRHAIVHNPKKHVVDKLIAFDRMEVRVSMDGLESVDHRATVRIELVVDNQPQVLPQSIWKKTIGSQRRVLLQLYGGDIRLSGAEAGGDDTAIAVEFLCGHF